MPLTPATYVVAVIACGAMIVFRWLLDPWLGNHLPYFTAYFAVIIAAWYGGLWPGLVALLASAVACVFFFAEPRYSFQLVPVLRYDTLRFAAVGVAVCLICESLHRNRRAAAEGRERLRTTLASIGDAVIAADTEGRITIMNAVAESLTGWALSDARGRPLKEVFRIVNEQTREEVENPALRALREGAIVGLANHTVLIARDGAERPIDDSAAPIRCAEGEIVGCVLVFRDITERRQVEQERQKFVSLAHNSGEFVGMCDLKFRPYFVNETGIHMVGLDSLEQAVRTPVEEFFFPEDRAFLMQEFFPRVVHDGRGEVEIRFRHFKTGEPIWMIYAVVALKDSTGKLSGYATLSRNITERRRLEQELRFHRDNLAQLVEQRTADVLRAEKAALRAQRLASVGTLASGLAHDITNITLPLGMRLNGLLANATLDDNVRSELTVVSSLVDHLRSMSRNLSLFARDPEHEGVIGSTELASWCVSVRGLMESSLSKDGLRSASRVQLKCDVPTGLPPVKIAPHRLTQAVINLVHNARDAIMSRIEVAGASRTDGCIILEAREREDGKAVLLKVTDDGCGMTPEVMQRAVEPFFTTKDRPMAAGASGSGLGLALAHSIAERAGGSLDIHSERGKGTTVTLTLPTAQSQPIQHASETDAAAPVWTA
jgi:PAS domain S-box-containing protein